jgi:Na+/proline symporter
VATFGTIYLAIAAVAKCGGLQAMNDKLRSVSDWSGSELRVFPDPSAWDPMYSWYIILAWLFVFGIEICTTGGFIGQRIYAAKDEKNASLSMLWFGFCYYVVNGWPWIVTGMASIIVLGSTNEIAGIANYQDTYPAMIVKLMPIGMLGLMAAAMIAAFMSTASTLLNWGSSLLVNDFYRRFLITGKSKHHYVWASRGCSLGLAVFSVWFAFQFDTITEILLRLQMYLIGGVLVYVFRWLWWRTNIWSEISAMLGSVIIALLIDFVLIKRFHIWEAEDSFVYIGQKLITVLIGTTVIWLITTLLTKPVDDKTLIKFYKHTVPPGPGWSRIRKLSGDDIPKPSSLGRILLTWLAGIAGLFGFLFCMGYLVTLRLALACIFLIVSTLGMIAYFKLYNTLEHSDDLD